MNFSRMKLVRHINSFKMDELVKNAMVNIFSKAVSSAQPANLISDEIKYVSRNDTLHIFQDIFDLKNRDVHLVGAGKAVSGMATAISGILGDRLKSGVISIPVGCSTGKLENSIIKCYEGANNNHPDDNSVLATNEIIKLVKSLDEKSFLLVLISGGGSALLSSPLSPVTLQEKCQLIRSLADAGADIVELNTVRKRLSNIKGGKLAILAHPAEVVSLLISDIIGERPEFVASGPTYDNTDASHYATDIIEKYSLQSILPKSIKNILYDSKLTVARPADLTVINYVLGNNASALNAAKNEALTYGYIPIVLSDLVHGDVDSLSVEYCYLVSTVIKLLKKSVDVPTARKLLKGLTNISIKSEAIEEILQLKLAMRSKGICLISGGEPTVKVTGSGKGGRSQQLALSFSLNIESEKQKENFLDEDYHVSILCAGTDGIDGPTDAAGAVGYDGLVADALKQNISVESFLKENNSYAFFDEFMSGKNHIKIGHTNTNVMDIHIVVIEPKPEEGITLFIC